ncbi:MAG TPA: hypothetical protein VG478_07110 [Acidimicrobiales bacterium]|jgi:hypothetical protein|nr:hypothetical protein [Acidimicrobiales bacterium]
MTSYLVVGVGAIGRRVVEHLGEGEDVMGVGRHDQWPPAEVVVLATPSPQHELATRALASGAHVVSTSDDLDDVDALLLVRPPDEQRLVVAAAAAPGLSGLLARHGATFLTQLDEIHVQSVGTGGPTCAIQHHRALGGTSLGWHDGAWQERPAGTGRELCWFPEPVGAHDCYRAELADPVLLHRAFPEADRITARVAATRRDRLTARLPMLRDPHPEGLVGAVRVELRGAAGTAREVVVLGAAQPLAGLAALVAAETARQVAGGAMPPGVVTLADAEVPTNALLGALADRGLRLERFEGTGARTAW